MEDPGIRLGCSYVGRNQHLQDEGQKSESRVPRQSDSGVTSTWGVRAFSVPVQQSASWSVVTLSLLLTHNIEYRSLPRRASHMRDILTNPFYRWENWGQVVPNTGIWSHLCQHQSQCSFLRRATSGYRHTEAHWEGREHPGCWQVVQTLMKRFQSAWKLKRTVPKVRKPSFSPFLKLILDIQFMILYSCL